MQMEQNRSYAKRYDQPFKKVRDVDRRVIDQGNEIFAAIQMVFQFASFPIQSPLFIIDPYEAAPLSAIAGVKTPMSTQITVTVAGKNGSAGDLSHTFPGYSTEHLIPVLGLYPGYDNQVTLTVEDESGNTQSTTITATTEPLDESFGTIDIISPAQVDKLNKNELYITCMANSYPSATDLEGEVRWLIKEHYSEGLPRNLGDSNPFYKFNDSRLFFRHVDAYALGGIDPVGRIYRLIDTDFTIHHDATQMPNSNLLIQSQDDNRNTVEDTLTVMDFETEEILKVVDYTEIFDPTIPQQPTNAPDDPNKIDWWHANSIEYDIAHNIYITSSRHQNVVVATDMDNNEIRWMLGSSTRWPERFQQYFLTPVDENGAPLYDFSNSEDVAAADRDFWNWAQHSAKIFTTNENPNIVEIMLFNNGSFRSYNPDRWIVPYENWSNAMYFRINMAEMTVQLLLDFGKELGSPYYSAYVGNVQYMEETNSLYINFGGTNENLDTGRNVGIIGDVPMDDFPPEYYFTAPIQEKVRIVEISMENKEVLFAFDRYMPGITGIYTSFQYKGMKADLYDFPIMR